MKINRKNLTAQRHLLDKKLKAWAAIRNDKPPPTGWLKAVRTALGMTSSQLAQRLEVTQPSISLLEEREPTGKVTLELLNKAAKALGCKVVYAIVPEDRNLETLVDNRAKQLASELVASVEHSMRLEAQGSEEAIQQIEQLAYELKSKMDSRLWNLMKSEKRKARKIE